MLADQTRLLHGLQRAIDTLAAKHSDPESQMLVSSASTLLRELALRSDTSFLREHLSRGIALLREKQDGDVSVEPVDDRASDNSPDALALALDQLREQLEGQVRASGGSVDPWSQRVFAWEAQIHLRNPPPHAASSGVAITEPSAAEVEAYLRAHYKDPSLRLRDFRPLIGGLQKLTILLDLESEAGVHSLVLRGEQPDRFFRFDLGEVSAEYEFIRLLFDAGLPVPEPLWVEHDSNRLGRRFLISRRAHGINYGSALNVEAMPQAATKSLVQTLARFHSISVDDNLARVQRTPMKSWLEFPRLEKNTAENIRRWMEALERPRNASPTIAAVQAWLVRNVPTDDAPCTFVHCDYAPHNVLIDGDQVSAVLDWESARIGDPAEDLGYLLGRCGPHIDRAEALRWYVEAGGPEISEYRLRYYDVFHVLKLLGACHFANALYAGDSDARNEWTPLAFQYFAASFSLPWQELTAAAERCRR